jgi:hypothetical protein
MEEKKKQSKARCHGGAAHAQQGTSACLPAGGNRAGVPPKSKQGNGSAVEACRLESGLRSRAVFGNLDPRRDNLRSQEDEVYVGEAPPYAVCECVDRSGNSLVWTGNSGSALGAEKVA